MTGLGSAREGGGARSPASSSQQWGLREAVCICTLSAIAVVAAIPERTGLLPALLALAVVTPRLVAVDMREHRLPNALVGVAALGVLLASLAGCVLDGRPDLLAAATGVLVGGVLLVLSLLGGLGMGDVKLGAVLAWAAALVDPSLAVVLVVLSVMFGGVQSAIVLLRTRDRRRSIAFGPALLAGYWLPVAWLAILPG